MSEHATQNGQRYMTEISRLLRIAEKAEKYGHHQWRDDILERIQEMPLSITVRDGWHEPGQLTDEGPVEYEILLTYGGPALRVWGELDDYSQPRNAYLQWQDWGTPWTRLHKQDPDDLLTFAQNFYYGE